MRLMIKKVNNGFILKECLAMTETLNIKKVE